MNEIAGALVGLVALLGLALVARRQDNETPWPEGAAQLDPLRCPECEDWEDRCTCND
jgi:hypothetical protein